MKQVLNKSLACVFLLHSPKTETLSPTSPPRRLSNAPLHSQHSQLKCSTRRSSMALRASLQSPRLLPHTPYLCPCLILPPCLGPFQDETHGGVESRDMAFLLMLLSQSIRSWYYNFMQLAAPSQSSEIKANKQNPTRLHSGKMQTYIFLLRWVHTSSTQTCGKGCTLHSLCCWWITKGHCKCTVSDFNVSLYIFFIFLLFIY